MAIDIVTFGEAMIRLSPPNFRRIEQAASLDVFVGGAELNTAVGLARLGHGSAWVSRLTRNPLGRLVANRAREAGVATDHVVWTDDDRVGIYFLEFGAAPRASSVLYDRKNAAIAGIQPGMVDWKAVFAGARWFHVTGITPALSADAAETTREALQAARAAGVKTSIDLNYRAKLWSQADAGRWMREFMQLCGVLITTEEDVERVFQIKGTSKATKKWRGGLLKEVSPASGSDHHPRESVGVEQYLDRHRLPGSNHLPHADLPGGNCRSPGRRRLLRGRPDSWPARERFAEGARFRRGRQRHQTLDSRRLCLDHT